MVRRGRRYLRVCWGALVLLIVQGILFPGCDQSDVAVDDLASVCGSCGDVYVGDDFISGDAKLDGLFKAVGSFGKATASIDASFKADVLALGEVFGSEVDASMSISDIVTVVKADIQGEISANVNGSLKVAFAPPVCAASVNVALEAQANCEAKSGCEVDAQCSSGEVSVSCGGKCTGGCSGTCSGGCAVEVSGECSGTCKGSCHVEAGMICEGTCKGACDGACSLENASGECEGECNGTCEGTCEMKAGGECSGQCEGKCEVEVEAECDGECSGSCEGECSGSCEGTAIPPSCSVDAECEASADCQASASAQASASLECTPPSVDIRFEFSAGVDANAQAAFMTRMDELQIRMISVVQGMYRMRSLIDAEYAAEIGIEPPIAQITGQIEGILNTNLDDFDIPAGRLVCVLPAFEDSFDIMTDAATSLAGTLQAQVSIVGILNVL